MLFALVIVNTKQLLMRDIEINIDIQISIIQNNLNVSYFQSFCRNGEHINCNKINYLLNVS